MERKTLQEIRRKTTKNLLWSLVESEREKNLKTFEKGELRFDLKKKKAYSRFSIDRKSVSINRNRQKLTKNFKCNFD